MAPRPHRRPRRLPRRRHATCNLRDGANKTKHGRRAALLWSALPLVTTLARRPPDRHRRLTADAPRHLPWQRRMAAAGRHLRRRVDLTPRRSPSGTGRYVGPLRMDDRKVEVNDDPRAASVRPNSISRLSLRTEAATSLRGFCVLLGRLRLKLEADERLVTHNLGLVTGLNHECLAGPISTTVPSS